jgi:nitroreductase
LDNERDFLAFETVMADRHSCRAFLPKPVPVDTINRIVQSAQKVPTWCNAQPWQMIITSGAETDRFRETMTNAMTSASHNSDIDFPAGYSGVYKARRSVCGWQLYGAVGITKGDRAGSTQQMSENFRFFGAPHVAIITTEVELGPYGVLDCGGFVTGFTLAATAAGVATIAQAALAGYANEIRTQFGISENRQIVCAISFGYEDTAHPANNFRTSRADLSGVIDWRS